MRIHYKDNNNIILSLAHPMLKTYKSISLSKSEMQVPQLGLFIPEFEAQLGCSRDPGCQPGTCDFLGTGESLSGCSENAGLNFGRSTLVSSC